MPEYNAYLVARKVRIAEPGPDGILTFVSKSFTIEGKDDRYHPMVDVATGAVLCDCPHFTFRLAQHCPTTTDVQFLCKHLLRAISNLRRHGFDL